MSRKFKLGQETVAVINDGAILLHRYHDRGSKGWKPIKGMPPIVSLEVSFAYVLTHRRLNARIMRATSSKVGDMAMQHKCLRKC